MQQDNALTNMITLLNGVILTMVSLTVHFGQILILTGLLLMISYQKETIQTDLVR